MSTYFTEVAKQNTLFLLRYSYHANSYNVSTKKCT